MRYKNEFTDRPLEREIIPVGKVANIYIREDITEETREREDGTTQTVYTCTEHHAQIPMRAGLTVTDALRDKILAKETEQEAERVRKIRNDLLDATDKEILPDRLNKSSSAFKAWSDYREALRDIPEQVGFPWEVEWPEKP